MGISSGKTVHEGRWEEIHPTHVRWGNLPTPVRAGGCQRSSRSADGTASSCSPHVQLLSHPGPQFLPDSALSPDSRSHRQHSLVLAEVVKCDFPEWWGIRTGPQRQWGLVNELVEIQHIPTFNRVPDKFLFRILSK